MGKIYASCYVNTFMANFEAKHSHPNMKEMSLLYVRYIDDIFMIWKGTKAELIAFTKEPNEKPKTIKFDFQISARKIAILDLIKYKDENNNTQTTLYHKPTDKKAFLHANSEHLGFLNNSTLCTQALILKTICSTAAEYDRNCATTEQKFLERQCKKEVLHEQIKKVDRTERKELFTNKENSNKNRVPLSITYNRTLHVISKIIPPINTQSHTVFQTKPMIAFKCSKNLQELLEVIQSNKEKFLRKICVDKTDIPRLGGRQNQLYAVHK